MKTITQPTKKNHWLRWILISFGIVALAVAGIVGYVVYRTTQQSGEDAVPTTPRYHGGACDSPTFYSEHQQYCALE